MEDVMRALEDLVDEGKIRSFGLSNESAWDTMQWLAAGELTGGSRIASVQNEYSHLCRMPNDADMSELFHNEQITLLAFSLLATGFVTGKYLDGALPEKSRHQIAGGSPRLSPKVDDAVKAYLAIAQKHDLDPVHLALAFCLKRPFPCIPIFADSVSNALAGINELPGRCRWRNRSPMSVVIAIPLTLNRPCGANHRDELQTASG